MPPLGRVLARPYFQYTATKIKKTKKRRREDEWVGNDPIDLKKVGRANAVCDALL